MNNKSLPNILLATAVAALAATQVPTMLRDHQFNQCKSQLFEIRDVPSREVSLSDQKAVKYFCGGY